MKYREVWAKGGDGLFGPAGGASGTPRERKGTSTHVSEERGVALQMAVPRTPAGVKMVVRTWTRGSDGRATWR